MAKVHLISFAAGPFEPRKEAFTQQASTLDLFETINVFNSNNLESSFRERHLNFMQNNPRGYGYWIWKPQIVLQTLQSAHKDDIVCYMDVGFSLNPAARDRFKDYIQLTLESNFRMLSFFNTHTEYKWTKADLAKKLSVHNSLEVMGTSQLAAGFFLSCPTESNINLVRQWRDIAVESNYHYSNDAPSSAPEHPKFKEHRHDASIFSLLRKIRGTSTTFYEVQSYSNYFENDKMSFPAWATRLRA